MTDLNAFANRLETALAELIDICEVKHGEVTVYLPASQLRQVCLTLRDDPNYAFTTLVDLCGVDYLHYGMSEWRTDESTRYGFDRAVHPLSDLPSDCPDDQRFAVVYHLLSIKHNQRLRLHTFAEGNPPMLDSVQDIFASSDWFEREAFDLFGILFNGHTDLRRILTDYGFIGHPFRKDFPLSGHVEMRYDKEQQRVVYEPVEITPRVLVPKIIRDNNRYSDHPEGQED